MASRLLQIAAVSVLLAACNGEIYLRDSVTDGDAFYIPPQAAADPDPVVQSWIRYSLARSVCQLDVETDNPARATSFDCEHTARRHLVEAWNYYVSLDPALRNGYLDDLNAVQEAGYLDEYVVHHHAKRSWTPPDDLEMRAFSEWRRDVLDGHRPQTRIIGYWSYRSTIRTSRADVK